MVGFTRVGRVARNPQAAMAFAIDITSFLKEKYHTTTQCWARTGGPTGQIVWQTTFENMSAMERFNEALLADDEYWDKVKEAQEAEFFERSSFEDGIWTSLG